MNISDEFELPDEMYQNNRPEDPEFSDEEDLYFRFRHLVDDEVSLPSIPFPNQSVNRSKYSEPEWVLFWDYPSVKHFGVAAFKVKDVPERLKSKGGVEWEFYVKHVPLEENYAHSEVRSLRDGEPMRNPKNKSIRIEYRVHIQKHTRVLRVPKAEDPQE